MPRFPSLSCCVLTAGAILSLGLTGCQTTNPYTGEQQVSKAGAGAGIGAVGGAILGGIIGNNVGDGDAGRGAAIGAAVGAMTGAGIGNYMDKQEAAIREQLEGTGVSVTRDGNDIVLNMPHDITFDVNRDRLKSDFVPTLDSVALVLNKYDRTLVDVNGHTDSTGSASHNQALSQRRAESVFQFLVSRKVDSRRLAIRGFGETQPIASNSTASGRASNRRVEIHIVPSR